MRLRHLRVKRWADKNNGGEEKKFMHKQTSNAGNRLHAYSTPDAIASQKGHPAVSPRRQIPVLL
jgi:hypothetical protein